MAELKLNKTNNVTSNDFDVIPDAPTVPVPSPSAQKSTNSTDSNENKSYIKADNSQEQTRQLFANKKANIAIGVSCALIIILIIIAVI